MGWNPIKKITNAVRGLGRLARGKWEEGLQDVGGGLQVGAAFIPGLGPLAAGGIGALGGLMESGGDLSSALKSGLGAGIGKFGISKLSGLLGGGGAGGLQAPESDGGGFLGGAKDLLGGALDFLGGDGGKLGGLKNLAGLGLAGASVLDNRSKRKDAEKSNAAQMKLFQDFLGKAESAYDEKEPLRKKGQEALLKAVEQHGSQGPGPFADFLKRRGSAGQANAGVYV